MDQKKIDKLYELLEQAEEELDDEAVAALRWANLTARGIGQNAERIDFGRRKTMKVNIYINGRPASSYSAEEMAGIREELTKRAMKAAGYIPAEGSSICRKGKDARLPA